jgi:WD40 repeat protein
MRHDASWINNITFNVDGTRLFAAPGANNYDNDLTIWDIEASPNGELTEPVSEWFGMHTNFVTDLQLSPDGRYLATASQDSTMKLWDATGNNAVEMLTLLGHPQSVNDIAFSPDSNKIATLSGGEVRIWDISEAGMGEFLNIADASWPTALYSETNTLVTFTRDGFVNIWDTATSTA